MYTSVEIDEIKDMVIAEVPRAERIYLFGSYARGTAREQSDLDIAVLMDADLNWRDRNDMLNRLYNGTAQKGYNVDFLLKRADLFFAESELPTLSRVILREGKLLWKS